MNDYYVSFFHDGKRTEETFRGNNMEHAFKVGKKAMKEKYKIEGTNWMVRRNQND